jgi:peptide/nickel transport system permease protein
MRSFVFRRLLQSIPLLIFISMLIFWLLQSVPGGPLTPYLQNPHITQADIIRLKHNFGLDQPLPFRYITWLGQITHGDFGYSTSNSEPVLQAIFERLPATLELMGTAFIISLVIGVVAGILAALRPYSWTDYIVTTFAFIGQSMPVFWFGLMLQLIFSVHGVPIGFGYIVQLPSAGMCASDDCPLDDRIVHLVLPTIVLSLISLATWSRFMRSSMLEVLKNEYMRTARAKGVSPLAVVLKHGLRNALIPLVTILGISVPGLFAGAVVTERIFAWPGMGRLFYSALGVFDFSLLMGYLMFVSILVVVGNLLADVGYAVLDPRVRAE